MSATAAAQPATVLLTGASGFIGSRLLDAACDAWGEQNVIVLSSRPARRGRSIVYGPGYAIDAAGQALAAEAQWLLHAGAFTPKSGATANDLAGCNGNIAFTAGLLGLELPKLARIVYLSTLDVYAAAPLIAEDSPVQPASLYGWSKLYCEQMVAQYAAQRGLVAQVLRIGHVYGPGEEQYAKVLPNAIRNILAGQPVELWGEGRELRSLIYIGDVLRAIMAAAELPQSLGVTNIVGGQPLAIRDLLQRVIALSGKPVPLVQRSWNGTPRDYVFDTSKMNAHLLPRETALDQGLLAELAHMDALRAPA
jgi:UDP-glucose 4-epimerase